ncbi:cation channel sperm-associated auxiliary subunit epsilon-like isoform X2 [Apostichopus japonicus]|uniref:cation channel sperm-associated auxiliary subunit epsilon-like isoform X2 n=1 Tax=Stichopus japonicus TaxID=307972 RepID=UPI003AB25613
MICHKLNSLMYLVGLIVTTAGGSYVSSWSVSQEGSSDSLFGFDTRSKVTLRFHERGDAQLFEFIEWIPPSSCAFSSTNNTDSYLTCPEGSYDISVKMRRKDSNDTITESKFIRFLDQPFCYKWNTFTDLSEWTNRGEARLRIWVTDPVYQGSAESNSLAKHPSQHSRRLTNLFQDSGQEPIPLEVFPETKDELQWNNVSYSLNGYWTVSMNIGERLQYIVRIEGKPGLTVNACLIRPTKVSISIPKFKTQMPSEGNLKLTGLLDLKKSIKDPCAIHVVVSIRNIVLFTQNGFLTTSEVYVNNTSMSEGDMLVDVAFTLDKLYFLMTSGQLLYMTTDGTFRSVKGVRSLGLTSIRSIEICLPSKNFLLKSREMLLAWNEMQIYLLEDGDTFHELLVPEDLTQISATGERVQVLIVDADFSANIDTVNVMLRIGNSSIVVLCYNLISQQWTRLGFWITDLSLHFQMKTYSGTVESIVFWNEEMLFLSERKGEGSSSFTFKERHDVNHSKTYLDKIENVEFCDNSHAFVQMITGILYYGTMEDRALLEISSLPPDRFLYCDVLGSVHSIFAHSANWTSKELILRNAELNSAFHSIDGEFSCLFIHFETMTGLKALYYIDRNESLFLWSRLTYTTSVYNDINVFNSKAKYISVNERSTVDYNHGRKTLNKSIVIQSSVDFYQSKDYNDSLQDATGLLTIQMKPLKAGVGCLTERSMTTHVAVGCPPGRHVRVHKPVQCTSFGTFILPSGSSIDEDGKAVLEAREVELDTNEYGCPLMSSHDTTFKPNLLLYEDDQFIEIVSVDYILYELQRRTDFTYNATQKEVGCRRPCQTWSHMKDSVGENSPFIWGPSNYRRCFVDDGTLEVSLDLPYEILNQTGLSALEWTKNELDQLYIFHLTVVEPNYSFCSLNTQFAVVVQGSLVGTQSSNEMTLFIFVSFTAITLSLGIASYAFFRKEHMAGWKRNQASEQEDTEGFEDKEDEEEMSQSEEEHMAARKQQRRHTVLEG